MIDADDDFEELRGESIAPERAERFYDRVRTRIQSYVDSKGAAVGKTAEFLLLVPDVFILLWRLVNDSRVSGKNKVLLGSGIAYFIFPIDLIPEAFVGPIGYLDDLVFGVYILNRVLADTDAAIGMRYGWRASFAVFGVAGILLGFVLRASLRDRSEAPRRSAIDLRAALREIASPAAICLLLAFVCANAVASVLFVWLPTFVHDRFHQNLAVAGLSATVFAQIGSLLGAMTGGYSADRVRARWKSGRIVVQAIGLFAGVPFVLMSGLGSSITFVAAAFFGWGFAKGIYEANIFASMFDITSPDTRGGVVGLMNMAGWLFGAGTAPIAVGYLAERTSLGFAIACTAAIYVAGGMFLVAACVTRREIHE